LVDSGNFGTFMGLDVLVRMSGGEGLITFAISAPKTGDTPVIVPTAKPTNMRPIITKPSVKNHIEIEMPYAWQHVQLQP